MHQKVHDLNFTPDAVMQVCFDIFMPRPNSRKVLSVKEILITLGPGKCKCRSRFPLEAAIANTSLIKFTLDSWSPKVQPQVDRIQTGNIATDRFEEELTRWLRADLAGPCLASAVFRSESV